jgi:hypothetical protein
LAIRKRTTKLLAKRHDLNYFRKGSPIRVWQWRLAAVALVAALVWIGLSSAHSAQAFSSGPISSSHAVFGQRCDACHKPIIAGAGFLPVGFGSSRKVADAACLACHAVGPHHAGQTVENGTKACSTCHIEHVGAMHLATAPVSGCTQCHGNLEVRGGGKPEVAANIDSFVKGHPEFRVLRTATPEVRSAAFGLKYNHADHLKAGLTGPNGPTKLECSYCHEVEDPRGRDIAHSGRMANVSFERSCQSCHTLDFDKRVKEQAPHADSATALKFVQAKMAETAPGDKAALARAETILFREKCALCHTVADAETLPHLTNASLSFAGTGAMMPSVFHPGASGKMSGDLIASTAPETLADSLKIAPSHQPERFFTAALFSHTAHSTVQCEECHAAALTSVSGTDNLMPGIATCQKCHDGQSRPQGPVLSSGHAESGCSLCHDYHEHVANLRPAPSQATFRIDELTSR